MYWYDRVELLVHYRVELSEVQHGPHTKEYTCRVRLLGTVRMLACAIFSNPCTYHRNMPEQYQRLTPRF